MPSSISKRLTLLRGFAAVLAATGGLAACSATNSSRTQELAPIVRPMSSAQPAAASGEQNTSPQGAVATPPEFAEPSSSDPVASAQVHVVAPGENLFRIALNNDMTTEQLAELNGIDAPYLIQPGQELLLSRANPAQHVARGPSVSEPGAIAPTPSSGRPPVATAETTHAAFGAIGSPRFVWPVEGNVVARDRRLSSGAVVPGWTISVQSGASVSAAAGGEVMYAGDGVPGFGNLVLLRHGNDWVTAYGHNERLLVESGAQVQAGDPIARAPEPRWSRRTNVYFEIRNGVTPVNPGQFLSRSIASNSPATR